MFPADGIKSFLIWMEMLMKDIYSPLVYLTTTEDNNEIKPEVRFNLINIKGVQGSLVFSFNHDQLLYLPPFDVNINQKCKTRHEEDPCFKMFVNSFIISGEHMEHVHLLLTQ